VPDDFLIIDPFCGTGSVGEAALRTGRAFLGADIDGDIVDAATKRLDEVRVGLASGRFPDERTQSLVRDLYVSGSTVHHSREVCHVTKLIPRVGLAACSVMLTLLPCSRIINFGRAGEAREQACAISDDGLYC
jgi:hypothetical protein